MASADEPMTLEEAIDLDRLVLALEYMKHVNLGHNHPEVIEAVHRVEGVPNLIQASIGSLICALGQALAAIAPGGARQELLLQQRCRGGGGCAAGPRRV